MNLGGYWRGLNEEKEEEYDDDDEDEEYDEDNFHDDVCHDDVCKISGLQEANSELPKLQLTSRYSRMSHCCSHGCSHDSSHDSQKQKRRMEAWQNNRMKAEIDKVGRSGMEVTRSNDISTLNKAGWTGMQYKIVATLEESEALKAE